MICNKCPRKCNIDKNNLNSRFCKVDKLKIGLVSLHHFEEPIISGTNGSGTIFFSGCNLKCNFCQNFELSHENKGKIITVKKLVEIFKDLENKGAHNINLVTPTPHINNIIKALKLYKPKIPIIYNSSGYESVEIIKKLKDLIDIYLVDLKYYDNTFASKVSLCGNYFECTTKAIKQMLINKPNIIIKNNLLKEGVIIRHLVLPNHTDDSIKILDYIKQNYNNCLISLMSQYTPCFKPLEEMNRKLKPIEYKRVLYYAKKLELDGYCQELESSNICYIPNFDGSGF